MKCSNCRVASLTGVLFIVAVVEVIVIGVFFWAKDRSTDYGHLQRRELICSGKHHVCLDKYPDSRDQFLEMYWND